MAVKKYFADSDTTITNAFKSNLTTRGVDANMGASDILETFSIYGQASADSTELERLLIKFPINEISEARAHDEVPASGSVKFYLKMYNAPNSQTIPRHMTLDIYAVSRSWQEGIGLDMSDYQDTVYPGNIGATWMSASSTAGWTIPGGDYHTSPVYSAYFDRGYEDLDIDVTPLIEEWIAGTKENYGFGIHLTASQEAYFADYYPREAVFFDRLSSLSGSNPTAVSSSTGRDTLSAWVKPAPAPEGFGYICQWQREPTNAAHVKYLRRTNDASLNKLEFHRRYSCGTGLHVITDASLLDNIWYHVAFSHDIADPTGGSTVLYINGISQSCTVTSCVAGVGFQPKCFTIGGLEAVTPGIGSSFWSGSIDDVAYYDRILTPTEMLEIYNGGCPNDLKSLVSSQPSLQHWWINGDDPQDAIRLGEPPTQISIYDQVGTYDLYATGTGGMAIVDSVCAGGTDLFGNDHPGAQLINLVGAQTSYYTKMFYARGTEWYYKRPILEACWDASIKDDRGRFYNNSPLLATAENFHTLFLYNIYAGRLRDIPDPFGTEEIYINIFSASAGGTALNPTTITGSRVSTGIYSFTEEINAYAIPGVTTLPFTLYDRWYICPDAVCPGGVGLIPVSTCSFDVISHEASCYHPASVKYVSTITNLQDAYASDETVRLRLFTRLKNWSPTIYTVATADIETTIVASASYMVYRVIDDLPVLPYGMTRDNSTAMSYDEKGNYFDLDMSFFDPGYAYGIKISFYDEKSWVEQPYSWKFRIEELDEY